MAAELAVPVADHDNALSVAVPGSSALQTAQLGPMAVAESLASGLPAGLPAGHSKLAGPLCKCECSGNCSRSCDGRRDQGCAIASQS